MLKDPDKGEFNITDYYHVVANSRPESTLDTNIVIIDVAFTIREDVIGVIDLLADLQPRVVGLDVTFNEPESGDKYLFEAIDKCPNLIMALGVDVDRKDDTGKFVPDDYSYFFTTHCDRHRHGVINLPSKSEGSTVQQFRKLFPMESGDTLPSLALAVTRIADPGAARTAESRSNILETIDYPSQQFDILPWYKLIDHPEFVKDKIVLIGAIGEAGDLHATPIDSKMPGVLIHAHAINTMMRQHYYTVTSETTGMIISFIICYIIIFIYLSYHSPAKGFWMRLTQLSFVVAALVIGYLLFINMRIIIDFSYTLMMITFAFFSLDLWEGMEHYTLKAFRALRRFGQRFHTQTA